jgi:hypothetical protein
MASKFSIRLATATETPSPVAELLLKIDREEGLKQPLRSVVCLLRMKALIRGIYVFLAGHDIQALTMNESYSA